MTEYAGFKWLSDHYNIEPVQFFQVVSLIGTGRHTKIGPILIEEIYAPALRPEPTLRGHLTFAFKYEVLHLEFLARLYEKIDPAELITWFGDEPTGRYVRRACFFYEWLTGKILDTPGVTIGNYVEALPSDQYFAATNVSNNPRWRVRNNLPGSPEFCPVVYRTKNLKQVEHYDCAKALRDLEIEYGAELLRKSAVWLTIKESKSSFAIEHEEDREDRIRRFAATMETRCGQGDNPLEEDSLIELQVDILGRAIRYGLRKSPVFVGQSTAYSNVVHYIAPHWNDTGSLMRGLRDTMERTKGASSLVRASVASFGFVYIHPMADGNGRISRFLVNDVLRRDGAVPGPFILPISATITNSSEAKVEYDRALERFSRPLIGRYKERYHFGRDVECEDGVVTNFHFDAYNEVLPAWRYPDLTTHSEYMGKVIRLTIEEEMSKEAMYLRSIMRAREGIKNYLEGPDQDIDRIIRSISANNAWKISGKLERSFPQLQDQKLAEKIVRAVRLAFEAVDEEDEDNEERNQ